MTWKMVSIITTTIMSLVCLVTAVTLYFDDPTMSIVIFSIAIMLSNQSLLISRKG